MTAEFHLLSDFNVMVTDSKTKMERVWEITGEGGSTHEARSSYGRCLPVLGSVKRMFLELRDGLQKHGNMDRARALN